MAESTTVGDYTTDHEALDGRWRAWWIRPDGYQAVREFGTRGEAVRWARYMEFLEGAAAE
jgi:hypothetical protein